MGAFTSALQLLTSGPPAHSDFWYRPVAGPVASGVPVNEETALTYSAVWCATRILSEGVAGLPAILYQRLAGGGKERATNELLYTLLHDEPNEETDAFQFFDMMTAWLVNWGNARAEIQRNGAGLPVALWPIHPSRIQIKQRRNDEPITYLVKNDVGPPTPIPAADMLDVCGPLSDDGINGKGVIQQAREAIGLGLATERYGASYFGNSANPSAVLSHPGRLKPEAEMNMRASWKKLYGGAKNAGEVAILQEGVKYEKVSFSPEDSQFLESRQHNVTEIARWYRVPPHMLADLSRATFSNIEEQGISFVVDSLRPWLIRWEKALTRKLIPKEQRSTYYVEFLADALTRGDIAKRTAALQIQLMNGAINIDEWRSIENRNPLPDGLGQIHFHPANLMRLEAASEPEETPPVDGEQPPEPAPEGDEAKPVESQEQAAATADIQATALNGAQIASMVQVSQLTVEEVFNQEAARGMLAAAFPLLTPEQINAIVDNLTPSKKPPEPAPMPFGGGPPKPDEEPVEEEPEDEPPEDEPELAKPFDPAILNDEIRLMHRIETREARHAAKHPERFVPWVDSFFEKHQAKVEAAFKVAGHEAHAMALAHCRSAKEELLTASECKASELESRIEALGVRWAGGAT